MPIASGMGLEGQERKGTFNHASLGNVAEAPRVRMWLGDTGARI